MRWQLGKVFPPPVHDQLNLTEEQENRLRELENEIKDRVMQILSSDQKKMLDRLQRRGPAGPRQLDRRLPGGGDEPSQPPPRGERQEPPVQESAAPQTSTNGIQWFATWESGLREAQRSGRPMLLVSAAPHCAGVPGIW
jgi:hypothetical protein